MDEPMTLCRNVAVGCLLLAFSAMGCGSKKPDAPKKKKDWASEPNTLATIGDSRITSDEIAHWINKGTRDAQQRYRTNSIPLRSLLETWVKDELLLAEARRLHLDEHPNLRFQIRHLLARAMEQRLHKELKPAPVTKKEIEAYYTKHQKKFHVEFLMRLQHVLVKTKAMAEKVAKEARAQEAEERKGEHGHGNPFGRLVRKYTIDEASKNIRGDLGFFSKPNAKVPEPVYRAALPLARTGDITVAKSKKGWHVIRLISRRNAAGLTLAQATPKILMTLNQKRRKVAIAAAMLNLRKKIAVRTFPNRLAGVVAKIKKPPIRKPKTPAIKRAP